PWPRTRTRGTHPEANCPKALTSAFLSGGAGAAAAASPSFAKVSRRVDGQVWNIFRTDAENLVAAISARRRFAAPQQYASDGKPDSSPMAGTVENDPPPYAAPLPSHFGRAVARPRTFSEFYKLFVGLFARRIVASRRNKLVEGRLGEAQPLLHVGDDLHHLTDEIAVIGLDDFGDEVGADRLPILIERDLPVRRLEHDLAQSFAELLVVVREIAFDVVKRLKHRVGGVVVVDGE